MVDVKTEIIIAKPIQVVAEYASNPNNAPEWYENIKSIEWKTEKPLAVGSKLAFVAEFLGRRLEYVYEVVELIPEQKMVMRTVDGPLPMETTYTWIEINDQTTKMTLRNRGKPSGFSKIFAPFMAMMMRRANNKDLQQIKVILERFNE
jgi:uncharacterized membrane protein